MSKSGTNVPDGELDHEFESAGWMDAYSKFRDHYYKPEYQLARLKARFFGIPKHYELLRNLANQKILKAMIAPCVEPDSLLSESSLLNTPKRRIKKLEAEIGALFSNVILNGHSDELHKEMKSLDGYLQKFEVDFRKGKIPIDFEVELGKSDKTTWNTKILNALDELKHEWYPEKVDYWLVTKAALKDRVHENDTGTTPIADREFARCLKDLGLSCLPERTKKVPKRIRNTSEKGG